MVNERYEENHEGQEEGEYHFSDDQINYDLESENSTETTSPLTLSSKENLLAKLKSRKTLIGIGVFIFLLFIVYRMLVPSTSTPPDFSPSSTPAQATREVSSVPVQTKVARPIVTPPPVVQTVPVPQTLPVISSPPVPVAQAPSMVTPPPSVTTTMPAATTPPTTVTPTTVVTQSGSVMDRLTYLEQQNSAMMNLLQTQNSQKLQTEAQNVELRNKIQELNSRLSNMEVAFRQLTQMIRSVSKPAPTAVAVTPVRSFQPKMAYTVQAIIPGRAWLKSELGDTVTVAEGDLLKGYGRITKIDPYDGIVSIDTGNRVVTLSYGASSE